MIPLYGKLAILGVGAVAAIGGVLFYQHKTAPAKLPGAGTPAPIPPKTISAPSAAVGPSGQTAAQIQAATDSADAQLASFLDTELASF